METREEKRKFTRINFTAQAVLSQGHHSTPVDLIDISLKGVMLNSFDVGRYDLKSPLQLHVTLAENVSIEMSICYVHREKNSVGFECQDIDADSMAHLRRLIELNLGDSEAAERELLDLFKQKPSSQTPSH